MPDFDGFERAFRHFLVTDSPDSAGAVATVIHGLGQDGKLPSLFRGKSEAELEGYLDRAQSSLAALVGPDALLVTSEDNLLGKDLKDEISGLEIELKSGDIKTDANSGVGIIAWAFDRPKEELQEIMSGEAIKRRREVGLQAVRGDQDPAAAVEPLKRDLMDQVFAFFDQVVLPGEGVPPKLDHFARSVAIGVTSEPTIKESFEAEVDPPLLLKCDWDEGLVVYEQAFDPDDVIRFQPLGRKDNRVQVQLESDGGRRLKIYPHFKNSYKDKSGLKVPADCWVQTPCFHIWVNR
jgi:hypothetical protein